MADGDLSGIDWAEPWFAGIASYGERLAEMGDGALCERLNRLLAAGGRDAAERARRMRVASGKPLAFAPQAELPDGQAYEAYIHRTGRVPTRENLHDLFNGLAWLAFPRTKARLNAMQAKALEQWSAPGSGRGPLRDAVTLFDENGLVLACANDELAQALRRFDWQALFVERRTATLMQAEPWAVGHGMLEKLLRPYKSITAHTLIVPVDDSYFRAGPDQRRAIVDRLVADWLDNWPFFSARDLCPLPVLGLPGWWPGNTAPGFYDDTEVFRPGRMRQR